MMKIILTLILTFGCCSTAFSSGLGKLFAEYQSALKTNESKLILEKSQAVYSYAKANLPENSKSRAAATMNYGTALSKAKQHDTAVTYLNASLTSFRKIYGEKAVEIIDPLLALADAKAAKDMRSYNSNGRYKHHLREALKIVEKAKGKDSVLYASVMLDAGKIMLDTLGDPGARRYLKPAYEAFSKNYNEHTYEYFFSSFYLGKYYMVRELYAKAEPYMATALELATDKNGVSNSLELTARAFLVEIYEELNEPEKSIAQCRAIGEANPFNMNQDPQPLFKRLPEYPKSAAFGRKEGYAIVDYTISDSGIPKDITISKTAGVSSFDREAEKFVKQLRFAPRFINGKPVDTPDWQYRVNFSMAK